MNMQATLEHVNLTVNDPAKTAEVLCNIFDWKVRWQGPGKDNGHTHHVGSDDSYLAIYSTGSSAPSNEDSYKTTGGLNHVGVLVSDLDAVETKVKAAGYKPHMHADYEPGRRFYFYDDNGVEFEVISYQ